MGLIGYPETSVGIHRSTMRKIPLERRYQASTSSVSQEIPCVFMEHNIYYVGTLRLFMMTTNLYAFLVCWRPKFSNF